MTEIRDAMEREGLRASVWQERDCLSLLRAVLAAQGVTPSLELPARLRSCKSDESAIAKAVKLYGSTRNAWLEIIAKEKALVETVSANPGSIGLTADEWMLEGYGMQRHAMPVVYGTDYLPYARTRTGLAVCATPIERIWSCRVS